MVDSDFLPLLGIVMGILGTGFVIMFTILNYQYRKKSDTLTLAKEKEVELTDNIERKIKEKLAVAVKEEMRDYIDNQVLYVKKEIASAIKIEDRDLKYQVELLYSKIDLVVAARATINNRIDNLERSVERLNQFSWGTNTKSYPAYITGEEETRSHNAAQGEGLFKDTEEEAMDRKKRNGRIK